MALSAQKEQQGLALIWQGRQMCPRVCSVSFGGLSMWLSSLEDWMKYCPVSTVYLKGEAVERLSSENSKSQKLHLYLGSITICRGSTVRLWSVGMPWTLTAECYCRSEKKEGRKFGLKGLQMAVVPAGPQCEKYSTPFWHHCGKWIGVNRCRVNRQ